MSCKTYYQDHDRVFGKEFLPLINMSRDEIIQEFLFVSKIHRYEKIWLQGHNKLPGGAVGYVGYAEAKKIIPLYGLRKHAIRNHLRINGDLGHLDRAIRKENQINVGEIK